MDSQNLSDPFLALKDEEDHGAILATVSVVACLITASSIAAKLFYRRKIQILKEYDYALLLGAVFVFIQSGLAVHAASLGLGRHRDTLDGVALSAISKTQYAISLLGIVAVFCTKLCMCLFIRAINTYTHILFANRILMGMTVVFCISSFFALAFRCPMPSPWWAASRETCAAAIPVHFFVHTSNMATDFLIFIISFAMVIQVQTSIGAKVLVITLFSLRLFCPITTAPMLLTPSYIFTGDDGDFTWSALEPTVWMIAASHVSVITACIPSLKSVFDSWLGNTFGINIDAPYQLERVEGKPTFSVSDRQAQMSRTQRTGLVHSKTLSSKLRRSNENESTLHRSKSSRLIANSAAALKLTTSSPTEAACFANGGEGDICDVRRASVQNKPKDDQSESVKGLTDGIIMIHNDVEVRFDEFDHRDGSSYSSRD